MDAAAIIVGFWTEQLKARTTPSPQVEGVAGSLMGQMQRRRRAVVTPEQVERFRAALNASVRAHPYLSFGVDYQPDAELVDACTVVRWKAPGSLCTH